ncbi:MAG: metallophosphoesterase [Fuerstiella sp.]|nr:metallophosphoesterase [Fuerstiella sp.]
MDLYAGIALLLLACIGNAAWWAILVNRAHSLRYDASNLKYVRKLHDVGIILFPPLAFWFMGWTESGLLRGGSVTELPFVLQVLLMFALCGLLPFICSVLRWQARQAPAELLKATSQHFDVLKIQHVESDRQAVRGERIPLLAKFPGNQIHRLEVTRKYLSLPGRQADAGRNRRTIKVAQLSDTHFVGCPGRRYFEFATDRLCELQPDIFVFTGDLIDDEELFPWAFDMFSRLSGVAPGYSILGNHDWRLNHGRIRKGLVDTGWVDLGEKHTSISIGDVSVLLAGTEAPWIGSNPEVPVPGDEDVRILLSHSPDQRNYAHQQQFDLMLCGHNHGGQVVLPVIGPVYAPSRYGVKYAGGTYRHQQMLIHVSRGLGAQEALRLNCCPEVTLLEVEI